MKRFLYLIVALFFFGCSTEPDTYNYEELYGEEGGFSNGDYCADVEYYNPNSGTRKTYTLNVGVEDNELYVIYWTNGGWSDDDHIDRVELDADGFAETVSDKGYQYEVQITGSPCSIDDSRAIRRQVENDEEEVVCPDCGNEKDRYDEYCDRCEHTSLDCGHYDPYLYYRWDQCSSCEDDERRREEDW
jgi:hypothetical protein